WGSKGAGGEGKGASTPRGADGQGVTSRREGAVGLRVAPIDRQRPGKSDRPSIASINVEIPDRAGKAGVHRGVLSGCRVEGDRIRGDRRHARVPTADGRPIVVRAASVHSRVRVPQGVVAKDRRRLTGIVKDHV